MSSPIVLLTQEFSPFAGGVATYCDQLARHIENENRRVVVVAPRYSHEDGDLDRAAPFKTVRYTESRFFVFRHYRRFAALAKTVRRDRPVLLWAADWRVGALVLPFSLAYRLPMAVSVYGSELLMAEQRPWKRLVARWVYRRAVAVFAISSYVVRLLGEFGIEGRAVHLVPLGVDGGPRGVDRTTAELDEQAAEVRRRHGVGGRHVLLTLARLTPRKGHDTTIEGLAEILKRREDVIYLIAGTGPDEGRLRALAERLGVAANVVFAGHVSDEEKAAYYRACDVFVMLSRRDDCLVEGFGMAYLEAGLESKPVVGTDHGGVRDAVVEGETGLLVPPRDSAAAAEAILGLLDDSDLRRRLGEAGRRRAARDFTWQGTARRSLTHLEPWLSQSATFERIE